MVGGYIALELNWGGKAVGVLRLSCFAAADNQ